MAYSYYAAGDPDGAAGDLKTAVVKDAAGTALDTRYYRYYAADTFAGGVQVGYAHGLKYALEPDGYERLAQALGANVDALTDAQVAPYADLYQEFDAGHRLTRERVQGAGCSVCSAGLGEYSFVYTTSGNPAGVNSWAAKTVETLPDGTRNVVYTNAYGQVMLKAFEDPAADSRWVDYYQYDAGGRVVLHVAPDGFGGTQLASPDWDEAAPDLVGWTAASGGYYAWLYRDVGLHTVYSYYDATTATATAPGGAAGYLQSVAVRQGQSGALIPQQQWRYYARTAGGATTYPVADETAYANADGSGGRVTGYAYTWLSTTSTQPATVTTTLPAVSVRQNGPGPAGGGALAPATAYDAKGRAVWARDAAGFLTYTAYDDATGAVVKTIRDVNTALAWDYDATYKPAGWATPAGGGLHLVDRYEVDALGRTTKSTDLAGRVTFTVYRDAADEVRTYVGARDLDPAAGLVSHGAYTLGPGGAGYEYLLGDMDGDGLADFVTVDRTASNGIAIWTWVKNVGGVPTGPASAPTAWGGTGAGWTALLGDMDGDGRDDFVAVYTAGANGAEWYWDRNVGGVRAGQTNPVVLFGGGANWKHLLGDMDGDGRDDFAAVYTAGANGAEWYWDRNVFGASAYGARAGAASPAVTFGGGAGWTHRLADLDGDGRDDFVAVYSAGAGPQAEWYWDRNVNGGREGLTRPAVGWGGVDGTWRFQVGDMDGDRADDLTAVWVGSAAVQANCYWLSQSWHAIGPTAVSREDRAGGYTESLTMSAAPHLTAGRPDGTEAVSGLQSLSRSYTNAAGQVTKTDAYFSFAAMTYAPGVVPGNQNLNFYRTEYQYDARGRQSRVLSPALTVTRTEYDGRGRAVGVWVGTDDSPAAGNWSPANLAGTDMTLVRANEYDADHPGLGLLTAVTEYPGLGAAARETRMWYHWRGREVLKKLGAGGNQSGSESTNRPLTTTAYNNLGEVIQTEVHDGDAQDGWSGVGSSSRRARTTYEYDDRGRLFRTSVWSVAPATGALSSTALTTDVWYDARGNAVKTAAPGGLVTKSAYDGAGRVTAAFSTDGGGDAVYVDAADVAGDTVLGQSEYAYDGSGNVILTTTRDRFHDATGTGALGTPASTTQPTARVSYRASYYDMAGRPVASVDLGTNGGTAYARYGLFAPPARSDTVLVTSTTYDAAGRVESGTDPKGIVSRTEYDALGRTTKTIQNYANGQVSDTDDKTTTYTYGPAGLTSLKAWTSPSAGQTTEYVYGVTAGTSGVTSNDVLAKTKWPDPATGAASASEQETVTVDALGQVLTRTDRNGTTHAYDYDAAGRLKADRVTTLGSLTPALDGTVARVEYGYDALGHQVLVTTYNAASGGAVVNQVLRQYNGLGQLANEYQSHAGAVSSSPAVSYAYSEMANGANHSRPVSVTYPSGFVLTSIYGAAGTLSDRISRLNSLWNVSTQLESYEYLGLSTVVARHRTQPGVSLLYAKLGAEAVGDAGDQYAGLDRFGRVVDQRWVTASNLAAVSRFQYGYDRDSNRMFRDDKVNAAFGEVYTYDGLGQLATFKRGTLDAARTGVTGVGNPALAWDYDATGNRDGVTTNGTFVGWGSNEQNEVTSVGGAAYAPAYDPDGNMTRDETGKQYRYDAWNRLVKVLNSSGGVLVTYSYDGLGRRVTETPSGGATKDLYYSDQWQVLEERTGGVASARYIWSPVYVDAVVLRDRDTDANGTLDERLYALQDANWNTAALVTTTGVVPRRFVYNPYGESADLSGSYGAPAGNYGWVYGFQGLRLDPASGLSEARNRWYSPTLGRWTTTDPIGFQAEDVNLYRFVGNNPSNHTDPKGLAVANLEIYTNDWNFSRLGQPLNPAAKSETERILNDAVSRFADASWKLRIQWISVKSDKDFWNLKLGPVSSSSRSASEVMAETSIVGLTGAAGLIYCYRKHQSFPQNTSTRLRLNLSDTGVGIDTFGQRSDYGMVLFRDGLFAGTFTRGLNGRQKDLAIGVTIAHEIMHALGLATHADEEGFVDSVSPPQSGLGTSVYTESTARYVLSQLGMKLR